MQRIHSLSGFRRWTAPFVCFAAITLPPAALAAPHVEFDFARTAECRDVTPPARFEQYPHQRLVEFTLPLSVRFSGLPMDDVDELDIEISGASAGLSVYDFAPATQLASDIAREIETTTTTKRARSLDGTLGGSLPVPYAEIVAHVSPSINAGMSSGETTTEKLKRLPPKHAIVVSGTSSEGRGVFFKLKRSSQTSLEGRHLLAVTFVAPAGWRGGGVQVACDARGQRKMFWIKQPATLGSEGDMVRLYLTGRGTVRRVAKPIITETALKSRSKRSNSKLDEVAAEVAVMVESAAPSGGGDKLKPQMNADGRRSGK